MEGGLYINAHLTFYPCKATWVLENRAQHMFPEGKRKYEVYTLPLFVWVLSMHLNPHKSLRKSYYLYQTGEETRAPKRSGNCRPASQLT